MKLSVAVALLTAVQGSLGCARYVYCGCNGKPGQLDNTLTGKVLKILKAEGDRDSQGNNCYGWAFQPTRYADGTTGDQIMWKCGSQQLATVGMNNCQIRELCQANGGTEDSNCRVKPF